MGPAHQSKGGGRRDRGRDLKLKESEVKKEN